MKKKYLIVGSSASSSSVINTLVNLKIEDEIICVTKDTNVSYNTCFIADYLSNKKTEEEIILPRKITLPIKKENNNLITFLYNKLVKNINPQEKYVILEDNQRIYYSKLFIGIGTEPKKIDYGAIEGIFKFHNFQDAYKIKTYISEKKVKVALVIGSGLTGLECADALSLLSISVTVVESHNTILSSLINRDEANWLMGKVREKVKILTNISISKYYKNKDKIVVILSNGIELLADIVILAIGCTVPLKMVREANINFTEGITTNSYLQTNYEDIYAGGDCAMVNSFNGNQLVKSSTWADAIIQGSVAGYNLANVPKKYNGLLKKISSSFFNIRFFKCGDITSELVFKNTQDFYGNIYLNKDKIVTGVSLMGNYEQSMESFFISVIFKQQKIDEIDIKGYR